MSDQLQQAVSLIKSGDQQNGRQILIDIIKTNPRNELAWLWMSSVVDTNDQRQHCLKQVLVINPHNELAQRGLEKLQPSPQTEAKPITSPQEQVKSKELLFEEAGLTPIRPRPSKPKPLDEPKTSPKHLPNSQQKVVAPQPTKTKSLSNTWVVILALTMVSCVGLSGVVFQTAGVDEIIIGVMVMLIGLFPIAGAYFNWNWFMESSRARLFVTMLGRGGARVVYSLIGIILLLMGLFMIIGIIDPFATNVSETF